MRVQLNRADCSEGCATCYLDCALCRVTMASLSREIELLLREQPPVASPLWPDWQDDLLGAQDHMTALQLRLVEIDPSVAAALEAGSRPVWVRSSLH